MRRLLALLAGLPALAAAAPNYRITDLGALTATSTSVGSAINASGQVTGYVTLAGARHAVIWSKGTMVDLGVDVGQNTQGSAINASGEVAGTAGPAVTYHAFRYGGATAVNLGGSLSAAFGINDAGTVVGKIGYATGTGGVSDSDAAVWANGNMTTLPKLPGGRFAAAQAITNSGLVAGTCLDANNNNHAVLWSNGTIVDLSGASSYGDVATSVNSSGVAVGTHFLQAVMFADGATIGLGVLPGRSQGRAYGINAAGTVIGESFAVNSITSTVYARAAFVWSDGAMTELNTLVDPSTPGWSLTSAAGINDAGQITGYGMINGVYHAYVATPVPEPTSLAALGLGVLALIRRRSRR